MRNDILKKQIDTINSDLTLDATLLNSKIQKEFNVLKSILIKLVSDVHNNPLKTTWTVSDIFPIVERMAKNESVIKCNISLLLKVVNYVSSNRFNLFNIHFVYFLDENDEKVALTPEQYYQLIQEKAPITSILSIEQISKIGGENNFFKKRLGFYLTVVEQNNNI